MGRYSGMGDGSGNWLSKQGAPITMGLLAALIVSFLAAWFTAGQPLPYLALVPGQILPWAFLTYPFADMGDGTSLFWFLIMLLWFYWVGTSVERDLGGRKYTIVLVAMTLVPALLMVIGWIAFGGGRPLIGPNLPIAGLTVAWGIRNSGSIIRLYGIIPVSGLILAILTVLLVFFGYGTGKPVLGVMAIGHLGLAYLFATNRLKGFPYSRPAVKQQAPSKAEQERERRYFEEVQKREQERAERERLRKLFESSGIDEPDK